MHYPTLSRRYATALFNSAPEENRVDIGMELEAISKLISEEKRVAMLFYHPLIAPEDKLSLIKRLLPKISEQIISYLKLLLQKKRGFLFLETVQVYQSILQEKGVMEKSAEVVSAADLNDKNKGVITELLSGFIGEKVLPIFLVDKDTIGGIKIRIGDKIFDGTIKYQLELLGKRLNAN